MKNKSPKPNNKMAKKGGNKQKSPIIKAKNVVETLKSKDVKVLPKKLNGTPKINNNSPVKSPKKGKKNKQSPINNSDSEDEISKKPAIGKFEGTLLLGDDKPAPKTTQKNKKLENSINKKIEKEATAAKKKKPGKAKQLLKAVDAKKAEVQMGKAQGNSKRKVGLIPTILRLTADKNMEQLQQLLPLIDSTIMSLTGNCESITKKRKLRILTAYKKKIESGKFGTVPPPAKKIQKGKPEVPKEMLDMSQEESDDDNEEDEDVTVAEKLDKAVENDTNDEVDDEEEVDDDSDVEEAPTPPVAKKQKPLLEPKQKSNKKSRYVLFVGNLSYETKEEDIKKHFQKSGSIISVRLGKHKDTNKSKGFAHIEFNSEEAYEKALSMHHTILNSRRINVMYSQGTTEKANEDKKKKNNPKVKDMKLKGMKDKGLLAGSTKQSQKRSVRRKKANSAKGDN